MTAKELRKYFKIKGKEDKFLYLTTENLRSIAKYEGKEVPEEVENEILDLLWKERFINSKDTKLISTNQ